MNMDQGLKKLKLLNQVHLVQNWDRLNPKDQQTVLDQINLIDPQTFKTQQKLVQESTALSPFEPFSAYEESGNQAYKDKGNQLINSGKVGCIILAGGQGTRLGFDGPKGAFVIPGIEKTLFQLFAEQIRGPVAIMTSPKNDAATKSYWEQNKFFNLKNIEFFQQSELPILDSSGNLFLEEAAHIAFGPNGNGSVFHHFAESGLLGQWLQNGIEIIQIILIDNALAHPFDAELIGYHSTKNAEITLKCTKRLDANEKVGVLVVSDHKVKVLEYSELGDHKEGDFLANLSLMCLDIHFFKKISKNALPLHKALKKVPYWDSKLQKQILPNQPNSWKFEEFVFDVIPYASKVEALACPRSECFAPLKNATGADSPATVLKALQSCSKELK